MSVFHPQQVVGGCVPLQATVESSCHPLACNMQTLNTPAAASKSNSKCRPGQLDLYGSMLLLPPPSCNTTTRPPHINASPSLPLYLPHTITSSSTAAYIEARVTARLRSSSQLRKHSWPIPKFAFEFGGVVLPLLLVLMSVAPAEPAFLLLFLLWGSLALKLWMRLAHGPASRQHMGHMLQHMTAPRKR